MDEKQIKTPEMTGEKKKKRLGKTGRIILYCVLGLIVIAAVVGSFCLDQILNRPETLFETSRQTTAEPAQTPPAVEIKDGVTAKPAEVPSLTSDPFAAEQNKDIVNILLIGTDAANKHYSSDQHADVMMVVAVNFKDNKVDLISLPRDTFTPLPGVRGFYKLNASLNVGEALYGTREAAYQYVCDAAEYQLGGMAVDYYYAVNFEAVVTLVDAIGGVDFDLDIPFTLNGVRYEPGKYHFNGQEVLKYLRLRKSTGDRSDLPRVDRQKRMMIAVFDQLKKENLLTSIPAILNTAINGFQTNTTLAQTTALANFALGIDADSIGMHTMPSYYKQTMHTSWLYVFVEEDKRVELIREIYGIETEEHLTDSFEYLSWLEVRGFKSLHALGVCDVVEQKIADQFAASGTEMTAEQLELQAAYREVYVQVQQALDAAAEQLAIDGDPDSAACRAPLDVVRELKQLFVVYVEACGYTKRLDYSSIKEWWTDPYINEVMVDFN